MSNFLLRCSLEQSALKSVFFVSIIDCSCYIFTSRLEFSSWLTGSHIRQTGSTLLLTLTLTDFVIYIVFALVL